MKYLSILTLMTAFAAFSTGASAQENLMSGAPNAGGKYVAKIENPGEACPEETCAPLLGEMNMQCEDKAQCENLNLNLMLGQKNSACSKCKLTFVLPQPQ